MCYETGGYRYNPKLIFPDGCALTLNEDGTGSATITKDFSESLQWSEADDAVSITGGYVLTEPKWDATGGELRMKYGGSDVEVVFMKGEGLPPLVAGDLEPIGGEAEATPEPEASAEPETTPELEASVKPEATPEPEATPDTAGEQAYTSPLFSVRFPAGWVSNEYGLSTGDGYCSVKYELMDADQNSLASVAVSASSESVDNYRSKIKSLTKYAEKAGGALEQATIGDISFLGTSYENWGWNYREYAARVPESGVTLNILIEQPENAGDALEGILGSIAFTPPRLDPPNVDPPLPEDGVPYEPTPDVVSAGKFTLKAEWIAPDKSIVLDSVFNNRIAVAGKKLYALTGDQLRAYTIKKNRLVPDGEILELPDNYESLSAGKDGILYASEGISSTLSVKDGKIVQDNAISGDVALHPSGKWGVSFWANADTQKVTAVSGALTAEPWILTGLSDPAQRKGRFSSVSCVYISENRVYVAGNDAENGDVQRVAVYDLGGKELFTFGALEWTEDDALGSVTGIVETKNGILVLDGNYRAFKLFSKDGAFLGAADADPLLGTSYPWLSSMIPADDGVYVAAGQRRADESCDELLLFKVSGF